MATQHPRAGLPTRLAALRATLCPQHTPLVPLGLSVRPSARSEPPRSHLLDGLRRASRKFQQPVGERR